MAVEPPDDPVMGLRELATFAVAFLIALLVLVVFLGR